MQRRTLTALSLFLLVGCSGKESEDSEAGTTATTDGGDDSGSGDGGDDGTGDGSDDGFFVDCESVADLMLTAPTSTVDDWSGYWLC